VITTQSRWRAAIQPAAQGRFSDRENCGELERGATLRTDRKGLLDFHKNLAFCREFNKNKALSLQGHKPNAGVRYRVDPIPAIIAAKPGIIILFRFLLTAQNTHATLI